MIFGTNKNIYIYYILNYKCILQFIYNICIIYILHTYYNIISFIVYSFIHNAPTLTMF